MGTVTRGGFAILAVEFVRARRWLAKVSRICERAESAAGLGGQLEAEADWGQGGPSTD